MRLVAAAAAVVLLTCAGCYGTTDPATQITQSSARFNAHGAANRGPATAYFEYEPTNGTGFVRTTFERSWPAGASGSFSEDVSGLLPATPYTFRLCGYDTDSGFATCAQRLSFTTAKPPGDGVEATFWFTGYRVARMDLSARSGPSGEHPSGSIWSPTYQGFVSCLYVKGDRAAVVFIGQDSQQNDPGPEYLWYTFAGPDEGVLNGGAGDGTGPDCKSLSLTAGVPPDPQRPFEIAIWDSP